MHDIQSNVQKWFSSMFKNCVGTRKWPRNKRTDESFISTERFHRKACIFDDAIKLVVIALLLVSPFYGNLVCVIVKIIFKKIPFPIAKKFDERGG